MDDNSNSQELIQFRSEIVKLNNGANTIKGNEAGEGPPELTQYINIHRVGLTDSIGKEYADCHSPASTELISNEMIQHHVVHGGMVVDMMVPQGSVPTDYSQHHLDRASMPQYIPEHYDNTEDLLSEHLTDEDRRLAAALVAVQLSQQQKHQLNHHGESNVIVSPRQHHMTTLSPLSPSPVEKPGMVAAAMVSSYIQAVEEEAAASSVHHMLPARTDHHQGERVMKMYQPQHQENRLPPLPPLKKVLSNYSAGIRHQYLRQMPEVTRHDAENILELDSRLHNQVLLEEEQDQQMHVEGNLIKEEVQYVVKNEGLGLYYEENGDSTLKNDSDYEVENERSSRRSLPHKKRIPRKLKNIKSAPPPKTVASKTYKCNKCGELCDSPAALTTHRSINHATATAAKKLFNCEICTRVFPNQLKFFEHLKSHYEPLMAGAMNGAEVEVVKDDKVTKAIKEPIPDIKTEMIMTKATSPTYNCMHCSKVFRRQKAYESHMNLVHPRTEEIEFSEPEDLMEGIREVVGGVASGDEGDMDMGPTVTPRGMKHVEDKEWYPDEELHAAEADIQELEEQHQQEQQQQLDVEQEDNVCQFCGDLFEDRDQVELHMQEVHLELQEELKDENVSPAGKGRRGSGGGKRGKKGGGAHLACPQCNRLFNHRNSLVYHLRSHSGERPHQCEVCGKSFFAASALKVHMRLHSGDKPYKCEFCGRHFRQWGDLKYHCISIHSEEKNYQCEYCGKDFARKYSLIVHRRIHTGEKNYKCEFCEKSFRASSYLQNHRRIHTGEKPHPCEVCGKPFRVRSDMKRHLNTHNRDRAGNRAATQYVESHIILSTEPKLEEQDNEQLSSSMLDHHSMSDHNSEMSARNEGSRGESILPDEHLNESSTDQEPINLNIAVPAIGTRQIATEVSEELVQYSRDPLEMVREGNNTLYVWPVFMT